MVTGYLRQMHATENRQRVALPPEEERARGFSDAGYLFFPALNSLRFLAAVSVFVYHVELYKSRCGAANMFGSFAIQQLGPQGVNLFFVLSSFLLTILLLQEAK